jgi:hypothetical protein
MANGNREWRKKKHPSLFWVLVTLFVILNFYFDYHQYPLGAAFDGLGLMALIIGYLKSSHSEDHWL